MAPARSIVVMVVTAAMLAAGCGSGSASSDHSGAPSASPRSGGSGAGSAPGAQAPAPAPRSTPAPGPAPHSLPTPAPTGRPADPAAVEVIRAWSSTLLRGDVSGAARYFALPSRMINPVGTGSAVAVLTIGTERQARAANSTLPCGAKLISADQRGRYVNALFRLTNRPGPGGGCGPGAGQTARTNFVIAGGRIVEWIRAPDDPGDNGGVVPGGPATPPGPAQPSTPPTPNV